jgi:NMD protein affecting ribosome stability and mRNA decay
MTHRPLVMNIDTDEPCKQCGKPSKPLRRGLCHACNEYFRRNGTHRPYVDVTYRDSIAEKHGQPCKRCGRPSNIKGYPTRGLCASCYAYVLRKERDGLPVKPFRKPTKDA